jgi:hypothetical protein
MEGKDKGKDIHLTVLGLSFGCVCSSLTPLVWPPSPVVWMPLVVTILLCNVANCHLAPLKQKNQTKKVHTPPFIFEKMSRSLS